MVKCKHIRKDINYYEKKLSNDVSRFFKRRESIIAFFDAFASH